MGVCAVVESYNIDKSIFLKKGFILKTFFSTYFMFSCCIVRYFVHIHNVI